MFIALHVHAQFDYHVSLFPKAKNPVQMPTPVHPKMNHLYTTVRPHAPSKPVRTRQTTSMALLAIRAKQPINHVPKHLPRGALARDDVLQLISNRIITLLAPLLIEPGR
jgi:hypothetical protein